MAVLKKFPKAKLIARFVRVCAAVLFIVTQKNTATIKLPSVIIAMT